MDDISYGAQWGKRCLLWHYHVGGVPYVKTGWALTGRQAERKAKQYFCKSCAGSTWNYYNGGLAAPCHVCRRELHVTLAGGVMTLDEAGY